MSENAPQNTDTPYKPKCEKLPEPPPVPKVPERGKCPQHCDCPEPPGGPPSSCLDDLIRSQSIVVTKADRAKAFVEELTEILGKVTAAQADYTQVRYAALLDTWTKQDTAIAELIRKLVCAVPCWDCLLDCNLCPQLVEIRALEERLNGTGPLTKKVYSLIDLLAWHERNVWNMQARVDRIKRVLSAWEKPADALADALDKNQTLIDDTSKIIATDPAKAIFDVFMTLVPRHWAIRPIGKLKSGEVKTAILPKYLDFCDCTDEACEHGDKSTDDQRAQHQRTQQRNEPKDDCEEEEPDPNRCDCDDGVPDDCCGPDVGVLSLRVRLLPPLPYLVEPAKFPDIICCLTRERLAPASDQLATAQADRAATAAEIERVTKAITDKTTGLEASFKADLVNPICGPYNEKTCVDKDKKDQPAQGGYQDTAQRDPRAAR
jgi:hypothetical protein